MTEFAPPRAQVAGALRRMAERLHVTFAGYSDLSVEQLARENNMTMHEAQPRARCDAVQGATT